MGDRKLRCVTRDAWLGGVCAGVAYFFGIPTWIVRMVWFLVAFFYGTGIFVYLLLWIFLPVWKETPPDYYIVTSS